MEKLLLLTLNEQEEKTIDKIISAIADYIQIEPMQVAPVSILSFPGLEIRQHPTSGTSRRKYTVSSSGFLLAMNFRSSCRLSYVTPDTLQVIDSLMRLHAVLNAWDSEYPSLCNWFAIVATVLRIVLMSFIESPLSFRYPHLPLFDLFSCCLLFYVLTIHFLVSFVKYYCNFYVYSNIKVLTFYTF